LGAVHPTFLYTNYNVWNMGFVFETFWGLVYERRGGGYGQKARENS